MNYLTQSELNKLNDVKLTSRDVMFAIYQLYGASGISVSLLGK